MNRKTLNPLILLALNILTAAVVLALLVTLVLGTLNWMFGFRSFSQFASTLQVGAIVILLLGLIGALSESSLSLHDRMMTSWISNIHSIRVRSGFHPFLKKRLSSLSLVGITGMAALILYSLSRIIYRFIT